MDKPKTKQRNHGRRSRPTTEPPQRTIRRNTAEGNKNNHPPALVNVQELMTPYEVAEKAGRSYPCVYKAIISGQLKAIKMAKRYYITPEQYEKWGREYPPLKVGRPTNTERQRRKLRRGHA